MNTFATWKVDIGLQEGPCRTFPQGIGDVLFTDAPQAAQVLENVLKFVGKSGKHR